MSRPRVFFDVTIGGQPAGRIEFEVTCAFCASRIALQRYCSQDCRELQMPLHGREGKGHVGCGSLLQELDLPQSDSRLHAPGWRHYRTGRWLPSPLRISMVMEVSPSTAESSPMRTSVCATTDLVSFPWLTRAPTPTVLSSSSPPFAFVAACDPRFLAPTSTVTTACSVRS